MTDFVFVHERCLCCSECEHFVRDPYSLGDDNACARCGCAKNVHELVRRNRKPGNNIPAFSNSFQQTLIGPSNQSNSQQTSPEPGGSLSSSSDDLSHFSNVFLNDLRSSLNKSGPLSTHFSTILARLRRQLDSGEGDNFAGPHRALHSIRTESLELIGPLRGLPRDELDLQVAIVYKKLVELASRVLKVCTSSPFCLPPKYSNEHLNTIFDMILMCLLEREVNRRSVDNDGHRVLGGVEGSGKTTMLQYVGIVACVVFERVTPIFWDYSKDEIGANFTGPVDILKAYCTHWMGLEPTTCLPSVSAMNCWLQDRNCVPCLLLDEIQKIFSNEPDELQRRLDIASDVHSFAKHQGTYVVMTGSSYKMRQYLFRKHFSPDPWCKYPDFNGSLFHFAHVPALRSAQEIADFVQVRYPSWQIDQKQLLHVLHATGGIGRHIEDYFRTMVLSAQPNFPLARRNQLINVLMNDSAFAYFASYVYDLCADQLTDMENAVVLPVLGVLGMSYGQLSTALAIYKYNPEVCISEWVDGGVAYAVLDASDTISRVEIAVPSDILGMQRNSALITDMGQIRSLFVVVSHILFGEGNAGLTFETLVRPQILNAVEGTWKTNVTFVSSVLGIDTSGHICVDGRQATVDDITGKLFEWSQETGLDAVWFQRVGSNIVISGWQSKCGHVDQRISGGKLATSRNNVKLQGGNFIVNDVNDKSIHGIITKAEIGFHKIATAVRSSFSSLKISFGTLLITTTKNGTDAMPYFKTNSTKHTLNSLWFRNLMITGLSLDVQFIDGISWVGKCLPSRLRRMLPPVWVELSDMQINKPSNKASPQCKLM
jgi:hypothetical protein